MARSCGRDDVANKKYASLPLRKSNCQGGDGEGAYIDAVLGDDARFDRPLGACLGARGELIVADGGNNCVRVVAPYTTGAVATLAGTPCGCGRGCLCACALRDGPRDAATFNTPWGVAAARDGRVFVAEVRASKA